MLKRSHVLGTEAGSCNPIWRDQGMRFDGWEAGGGDGQPTKGAVYAQVWRRNRARHSEGVGWRPFSGTGTPDR